MAKANLEDDRNSRRLSDDDFDFGSQSSLSAVAVNREPSQSFTRTRVMRDYSTGEIKGWEEFYDLVRLNEPTLSQS